MQLIVSGVYGTVHEAGVEPTPPCVIPGTVMAVVKGKGLAIACGDGMLYVNRLQLAQKREMDYSSFVNGNPQSVGALLGA